MFKGHTSAISTVVFSPDGKLIASGSSDFTVRLWDPTTGTSMRIIWDKDRVWDVAFSPDSKLVASVTWALRGRVRLWDSVTGRLHCVLKGHLATVRRAIFSPDGKLVSSASEDRTVRLWESATGALHCVLEGYLGEVWAVAFSPDSKLVVSASGDKTLRL